MATSHSDRDRQRSVDISPTASEDEAAAIMVAIEQVLTESDTTDEPDTFDPWIRALRFESVADFRGRPSPDAPSDPWIAMGRNRR